jgi:hypothetical protein
MTQSGSEELCDLGALTTQLRQQLKDARHECASLDRESLETRRLANIYSAAAHSLQEDCVRLGQELETYKADALRYRWLRAQRPQPWENIPMSILMKFNRGGDESELDRAIDATIALETSGERINLRGVF